MSSGTSARRRRLLSPASSLEVAFTLNLVLDEQSPATSDESASALAAKALVANVAGVIKNKVDDGTIISDLVANINAEDPSAATVSFSVDQAKSNVKLGTMETTTTTELVKPAPSPGEPAPAEDDALLTWIVVPVAVCVNILILASAAFLIYRKRSGVGRGEGARGSSNASISVETMPATSTGRSAMHRNLTRDDVAAATRGMGSSAVAAGPTRQLNSLTTDELVPLLEGCNFNANIVASFLSNGITGADLAFINDATELLVLGKWWLGPSVCYVVLGMN